MRLRVFAVSLLAGLVTFALLLGAYVFLNNFTHSPVQAATFQKQIAQIARPTSTSTLTITPTPTKTKTAKPTPTDTPTPSPTATNTSTLTPTPTRTRTATPRPIPPTATPVPVVVNPTAQRVFDLTNAERLKAGLAPLHWNINLLHAAEWFAYDMAVQRPGSLTHIDSQGRAAPDRMLAFGYRWLYYAENIAMGQKSPEEVVADWMASPHHRDNILNPRMTEIGVALAASDGWNYWVQDFGTR